MWNSLWKRAFCGLAVTFLSTAAAVAETVTLRMSNWLPAKHQILTGSIQPWIDEVEKASNGTLEIRIDPASIAPPPEQYDVVRNGAADLAYHVVAYTPGPFEIVRGVELPFLSPNAEVGSQAVVDWYERNIGFDAEFKDVKVISIMVHGPGAIHTREPVTTLADLKGVKLRVGGGGVRLSEALGATPVTMPGSQAYEAIQKGVADGAMFPLEAVAGFRLYELVNHHLVIPGGLYTTPFALIMNRDRYESLSETQRAALDSVSGVKAAAILGKGWDEADENGLEAALENGGTITEISTEELAKMREAASVVTSNWIELANSRGLDGHALYDDLVATIEKYAGR